MTTNHPEKLDPALIRPGRIDQIIYLGYIKAKEAIEMLEYYFEEKLIQRQIDRIYELFDDTSKKSGVSPAKLEQMCVVNDSIDSLLDKIPAVINGRHDFVSYI